ncbi:hypothetical protein WJX82_000751 [Trebouxia sp. C0006]
MTEVRGQRLFLIPIGKENPHQHTIDGKLPTGVPLHTTASKLLPCWGVTDGNYLVKNQLRAEAGDVFAFIRAKSAGQTAYVHRLAVLDSFVRDEAAASDLNQLQHNYSMGGRKKDSVPFTWIMKLAHVVPVHIDKQTILTWLGIPTYDPILSARPAILSCGKNAKQAAKVLERCNAMLRSSTPPTWSPAGRRPIPRPRGCKDKPQLPFASCHHIP